MGRRIAKTIGGTTTAFHYDHLDIVGESGSGGGAVYLRTLAVDEALARSDGEGTLSLLADPLGSTVALVTETGMVAVTYTYEPFGSAQTNGALSPNPIQFTGRENDGTGLYYYRARYYDPGRARFLSEDPIGLAGGPNAYAYVSGNPMRYRDPMGLFGYGHHHELTRQAMVNAGVDPRTAESIARGTGEVDVLRDSQKEWNSPWHAMCPRDQHDINKGLADIRNYIRTQLARCNLDGLTRALHAAQDAAAPQHRGCQPYPGTWGSYALHILKELKPSPSALEEAARNTREILRRYEETCRCLTR